MSVDLADYADSLRRAITPLGGTAIAVGDDMLVQHLADAFWNARLDGFFPKYVANEDGVITALNGDGTDLPREWISLIVLYASIDALTKQVLSTRTKFRAKAGPVEFEQENSATVLAEMLKQLAASKKRLLEDLLDSASGTTPVYLIDAYSTRSLSAISYYGSPELLG